MRERGRERDRERERNRERERETQRERETERDRERDRQTDLRILQAERPVKTHNKVKVKFELTFTACIFIALQ